MSVDIRAQKSIKSHKIWNYEIMKFCKYEIDLQNFWIFSNMYPVRSQKYWTLRAIHKLQYIDK